MRVTITSPDILERLVRDTRPLYSDSLEDICKEAVRSNDFSEISELVDGEISKGRSEIVAAVLALICEHPNPELTVATLGLIIGNNLNGTDYQAAIARRFGISKSAVNQREKLLRKQLGWQSSNGNKVEYDYSDELENGNGDSN